MCSAEDLGGDKSDVKRAAKQVMNNASSKRVISKQEATVLLGDLDLYTCSETIVTVSISNCKKVTIDKSSSDAGYSSVIQEYMRRHSTYNQLSLNDFFHLTRNNDDNRGSKKFCIPHFVGCSGQPTYPPSESYARHTLIVHKPWRSCPDCDNWIGEFERFINSDDCPVSAKVEYLRVMHRYMDKMTFYEPKATKTTISDLGMEGEDRDILDLTNMIERDNYDREI